MAAVAPDLHRDFEISSLLPKLLPSLLKLPQLFVTTSTPTLLLAGVIPGLLQMAPKVAVTIRVLETGRAAAISEWGKLYDEAVPVQEVVRPIYCKSRRA